ncbi:hypothetical protein R6Q59_009992 [Mikania micrantha]
MTSVVQGRPDPFALDDPRALKKAAAQFDNQRYVVPQTLTSPKDQSNRSTKRQSIATQPTNELRSIPSSDRLVAQKIAQLASPPAAEGSGNETNVQSPRPSMPRTLGSAESTTSVPDVVDSISDVKPTEKPKEISRSKQSNSKMHQTSSKILRMTDDDRPFTRDFKDLFATLMTSLPLTAHRVRFSKVDETFLSEEAINHLGSLKFSQSNRIPDPKNPSRWIVTTTTTTFSMAKEMARSVCQRFLEARLIESAEGKDYTTFPTKGAVWQMTPKGTAVLRRFCDRNGIEAKHIEPIIRRPQMQMVELERNPDTDHIIHDKSTTEVIFRRFAGQQGPNLKNSTQVADSDSVSEYSTGLVGVKMAKDRRINDKVVGYSFTGKIASDWLLDCCITIDRRETYEICELFIRFGLIQSLVEDRAYNRTLPQASTFQPTKHSIYTITERGQRLCGWLCRTTSTSSDEGFDRPRIPKDTNVNRLNAILKDPALRMLFKEHLKVSLCEENLNFYLDAQDFVTNYHYLENAGRLQRSESVRETLATAYGLYNSFLASGAPSELNIDHALRNKLDSRMTQTESDKQNSSGTLESVVELIKDASTSVFKLMATDSVPKFIREPRYQHILREHNFDVNSSSRGYASPASSSDTSLAECRPSTQRTESS